MKFLPSNWIRIVLAVAAIAGPRSFAADSPAVAGFRTEIRPLLKEFCFDCHGDGEKKGNVAFDAFASDEALVADRDLWFHALKNLRSELMPPPKKSQPTAAQKARLEDWIKSGALGANPADPDPGRVTLRRLNRVEYRNTVRDLLGVEFDTEKEFPPDDAGRGFDNLGDVLTLPPILLEKYLAAARTVVGRAVPSVPLEPAERVIPGRDFRKAPATNASPNLSYYEKASATNVLSVAKPGRYRIVMDATANERFVDNQFDYNKCRLAFRVDGHEWFGGEYSREGGRAIHGEYDVDWTPGEHAFVFETDPALPAKKQVRSLSFKIESVTVRGPLDPKEWVRPKNHDKYFAKEIPADASGRRAYARGILAPFLAKAYRRPVDPATTERLVGLAESTYAQPGVTFEAGIAQAMTAALASPRFLFREEPLEPARGGSRYPLVDEFALASRLSYFLWSSMPDDELLRLAGEGKLRSGLGIQVRRMQADSKFDGFIRNFVGQWLQARDIETVAIDARQVLAREMPVDPEFEKKRLRFRELRDKPEKSLTPEETKEVDALRTVVFGAFRQPPRTELNGDIRRAMRSETEKTFQYIVREDRPLLELVDGNYTFLNEKLARHYGLTNLGVSGDEMRRVTFAPGDPHGGVLTQGSVLGVTSNPTRTSPVKRGLFVLDNILGAPPAPPPPDIPSLEETAKKSKDKILTLRETLAIHREKPLCTSCHNRMDPLGLALENFNAMGIWRDQERGSAIDPSGQLLSGESFTDIVGLKHALAANHSTEIYRTVAEKLLTYALGRGLEYHDVATVDGVVERVRAAGGRSSALFDAVVDSAAFQKSRERAPGAGAAASVGQPN